jgi:thiamine-phosphate pyrophosphorylase
MFELIVISKPGIFAGETTIIQQLFEAGLERFHLRKPDADEQAVRQLLDAIPVAYHPGIALHGFHQLANEYNIRRLHFTEAHRRETNETTVEQLGKDHILSTSIHDLSELETLSQFFRYTFFSPVFDSISKQEYKGMLEDGFYLGNEEKPVPVIALGGIDAGNLQRVAGMNFDGAALLGTIWNEPAKAIDNFKIVKRQQESIWRQQCCPTSKKSQS